MSDASVAVGQDQDMPRPRPVNTAQAAELAGMDQATFRKAMMRERQRGRDYRLPEAQWVDKRTPLYDGTAVESWAKGRKS